MGLYNAPSDLDYWDDVKRRMIIELHCERCGDPVEWLIGDGEPPRPFRCPACTETIRQQMPTTAIVLITHVEETKTRSGASYWRYFARHGLETIGLGTYSERDALLLQAAHDEQKPALVSWRPRVIHDHPIASVEYPLVVHP